MESIIVIAKFFGWVIGGGCGGRRLLASAVAGQGRATARASVDLCGGVHATTATTATANTLVIFFFDNRPDSHHVSRHQRSRSQEY